MKELLNDNPCVGIGTIRGNKTRCSWSDNQLDHGERAVALRRTHPQHTNSVVWLNPGQVNEVIEALESFDKTDVTDERKAISPSGNIGYYTPYSNRYHCVACDESIEREEGVLFFSRAGSSRQTSRVGDRTGGVTDTIGTGKPDRGTTAPPEDSRDAVLGGRESAEGLALRSHDGYPTNRSARGDRGESASRRGREASQSG